MMRQGGHLPDSPGKRRQRAPSIEFTSFPPLAWEVEPFACSSLRTLLELGLEARILWNAVGLGS